MRIVFWVGLTILLLVLMVVAYYWMVAPYRRWLFEKLLQPNERDTVKASLKRYLPSVADRFEKAAVIAWKEQRLSYIVGGVCFLASVGFIAWCVSLIASDRTIVVGLGLLPLALLALLFFLYYYPLVYIWKEPFVARQK